MKSLSAGLLMFRMIDGQPEFYLVHPGGPFWSKKDEGIWSIPKGLAEEGELMLDAAKREFEEETGFTALGPFLELGEAKLKSGKRILAWGFERDVGDAELRSNAF